MINYSASGKLTVGRGVGTGTGNVGKGVDSPGVGAGGRVKLSVGARVWLVPAWANAIDAESRTTSFIILVVRVSCNRIRMKWRRRSACRLLAIYSKNVSVVARLAILPLQVWAGGGSVLPADVDRTI